MLSGGDRFIEWMLAVEGGNEPEIRALLLRTLVEDDLVALAAVFWTQFCWAVLVLMTGWIGLLVPMGLDLLLVALRWRFRRRLMRVEETETDPRARLIAPLNILSMSLITFETIMLFETPSIRLTALGIMLPLGFLSYAASLYAAFPRLALVTILQLVVALMIGLSQSPFEDLRLLALVVPFGGGAFIVLMRRTHVSLIESVRARHRNHLEAMHDALTGLPNRRLMLDRLRRCGTVSRTAPGWIGTGVLCLDLDGFKAVNDGFGHAAGDAVLIHVANVLRGIVRQGDTVSRLSGDEFVVILPGIDDPNLRAVAERIVAAIRRPVDLGLGSPVRIGVSIGIAQATPDGTAEALLARADAALYEAKRSGKGRFELAS